VRDLALAGAPNTRDLGGWPTVDGRTVAVGRFFRAPALGRATDADVEALGALGLRTVVDLRDASEIAFAPPDRLPAGTDVVPLPIYDPDHPVFTYVAAVMQGSDQEGYSALAEEGTPGAMAAIYRWFVNGEHARERFANAVRLVAEPGRLPVLVHCSAGKDRTGWLSAILLRIAGVSAADVEADYLATNALSASVNKSIVGAMRARRPDLDEETIWPVFEARTAYLDAADEEVDRLYGSFDEYVHSGLGIDRPLRDAVRTALLDG
jgi:protein-tyrosine phosphatase